MNDDLVKQSIAELQDLVRCRCHEAYKDRGLHDPACCCDYAEALKVVSDRIEELEAKLDRVAQDLDNAVFAWDQHHYGGDMMEGWWVPDARSALADLKGEDE